MKLDVQVARWVLDDVGLIEGDGGQLHGVALHFGLVGLKLANQPLVIVAVGRRGSFGEARLKRVDLPWDTVERFLHAIPGKLGHQLLGLLGGDDVELSVGTLVGCVPLRVIPMEVRVDQITHRLRRDFLLDLGDQRCGSGGFGMRIDHQDVVGVNENGGVAIGQDLRPSQRGVNVVGDFLDGE
jgi:hypothetical protein